MVRVAVFDDSREQRDALEALLGTMPGLDCVGVFAHARDAVDDIGRVKADVVLMDVDMPGVNGIEGAARLRDAYPDLRILMLTVIEDDDRIFSAIRAGADGYFLKQTPPLKLVEGIQEAMEGGAPMSPSVARRVLGMVDAGPARRPVRDFDLSPREREILGLLVQGHTYKRIAADLGLAFGTVNKHVGNVYQKLRVKSLGEAVALAVRSGLF